MDGKHVATRDAPTVSTRRPVKVNRIVDLFAGPGGWDVAARDLGLAADGIEWDVDACATRKAAGLLTCEGDVHKFGPHNYMNANILIASPPCQTYTVAGSGAGRRALDEVLALVKRLAAAPEDLKTVLETVVDERTWLVAEPLRWALEALKAKRPYDVIALEQVPSVLPVWVEVGKVLKAHGYDVKCGVLRTEMFGVPQTRRRAVMIARRGISAVFPEPTHQQYQKGVPAANLKSGVRQWNSMASVLNRKQSFVVVSNYGTGGDPKLRGRRRSDEPSATVTSKVSRNRLVIGKPEIDLPRFSLAEQGLLQSFPADYPWRGRNIAQQIGNAIPPRLAMHILAAALDVELDPETAKPLKQPVVTREFPVWT